MAEKRQGPKVVELSQNFDRRPKALLRPSISTSSSNSSIFVAIALTIAMLYFGRQIFIPLALSLVLSFLLTPLVSLLEKIRLGRIPAVLVVLALGFVLVFGVAWAVAGQLLEITAHIRDYKTNLTDKIQSLHFSRSGALGEATATVRELNKDLAAPLADGSDQPSGANRTPRPARPVAVQLTPPPSNLVEDLANFLGPIAAPIETTGIVVIFAAFMMIKREDLRNRLLRLGGQGQLHVMTQALDDASRRLSRYLMLQFLVNAGYGFLFGLGLYFVGIPHALLWGVLGALLRFVPYIGTLIAAAFPAALALAVFPGWKHALLTLAIFLVVELVIANVIEPWLYGSQTGISSLAILVAAVFWAMLWGPVGLILATPLTVCLMILGRYVPQLSVFEVLLGDEPVLKPEELFYQRLLAMDQEEARDIADAHLQEKPMEDLFQNVLIPALRLAEEDRHMNALGDQISGSIFQSTRELIEEVGDRLTEEAAKEGVTPMPSDPLFASAGVVCIPARDEADELVGMMLSYLLRRVGNNASYLPIGAVDDMLEQVSRGGFQIVCVSALPPFAVGQARSLCKRLRAKFPDITIIVGLWDFAGGVPKAQERVGQACTDAVVTSLPEALLQVRRLAQSAPVEQDATSSA